MTLLAWILSTPIVQRRDVVIDTRGPWPVAIRGNYARQVESRNDFAMFVCRAMPVESQNREVTELSLLNR
jgi:hypothetical protein